MPRIEDHIHRAMQVGKFDDLPGKGKPLKIEENPLEDPEWRLAHHMLRNSGYTLPWIQVRQEIEADIERARLALRRTWEWKRSATDQPHELVASEWQRAVTRFEEQITAINKRIFDFNLQAPSGKFHLHQLGLEQEIAACSQ